MRAIAEIEPEEADGLPDMDEALDAGGTEDVLAALAAELDALRSEDGEG